VQPPRQPARLMRRGSQMHTVSFRVFVSMSASISANVSQCPKWAETCPLLTGIAIFNAVSSY
jgi:hypothetical protein